MTNVSTKSGAAWATPAAPLLTALLPAAILHVITGVIILQTEVYKRPQFGMDGSIFYFMFLLCQKSRVQSFGCNILLYIAFAILLPF